MIPVLDPAQVRLGQPQVLTSSPLASSAASLSRRRLTSGTSSTGGLGEDPVEKSAAASVRRTVTVLFYPRSTPGTGGYSPQCSGVKEELVSKSAAKELTGRHCAEKNRGIMGFSFP